MLRTALLRPGLLEIASEGMQRLRLAEGPEIPYTADRLRMALPLQPGAPLALRRRHRAVTCAPACRPAGDASASLTIGSLDLHLEFRPAAQAGEPALQFSLECRGDRSAGVRSPGRSVRGLPA